MASELRRTFTSEKAVRDSIPLVIGITGYSGSGKTYSALRLATGIQRIYGGPGIFAIDADNGRMKQYAPEPGKAAGQGEFEFTRVPLAPPHGPADWLAAIEHCVNEGARVIVADPMSYEHDGEGGILETFDRWMEAKCGNDYDKRARMNQVAWGQVKKPRAVLNRRIKSLVNVAFVLTYQAKEKMKMDKGKAPESKGWQPVTTSDLVSDMTLRFLLHPGADGVPDLKGETTAEKLLIKSSASFRGWFKGDEPLTEALGERIARWTKGGGVGAIVANPPANTQTPAKSSANTQQQPKPQSKAQPKPPTQPAAKPDSGSAADDPRFHGYFEDDWKGQKIVGSPVDVRARYDAWLENRVANTADPKRKADGTKVLEDFRELNIQLIAEERMRAEESAA